MEVAKICLELIKEGLGVCSMLHKADKSRTWRCLNANTRVLLNAYIIIYLAGICICFVKAAYLFNEMLIEGCILFRGTGCHHLGSISLRRYPLVRLGSQVGRWAVSLAELQQAVVRLYQQEVCPVGQAVVK